MSSEIDPQNKKDLLDKQNASDYNKGMNEQKIMSHLKTNYLKCQTIMPIMGVWQDKP